MTTAHDRARLSAYELIRASRDKDPDAAIATLQSVAGDVDLPEQVIAVIRELADTSVAIIDAVSERYPGMAGLIDAATMHALTLPS